MPGEKVGLITRPVGGVRHSLRVVCNRPPEVGNKAVKIIDGFDPFAVRRAEQHGGAARERLDIIVNRTECSPHV